LWDLPVQGAGGTFANGAFTLDGSSAPPVDLEQFSANERKPVFIFICMY
jgi:hypothetical protein